MTSAAADHPLPIRGRRDLIAVEQQWQGRPGWLIKDPLRHAFFRLDEHEFILLQELNGRNNLIELLGLLRGQCPAGLWSTHNVQATAAHLVSLGLAISTAPGATDHLNGRIAQTRRMSRWLGPLSLMALRIPLGSPDGLLRLVFPLVSWMFHPVSLLLWGLTILGAGLWLLSHLNEFLARLPEAAAFFGPRQFLWLGLTLAVTKIIHELGHALTCRYFGGSVREAGIMLFCLMPCLYCDVSDSWMLPHKWQRVAVAAAGMLIELLLAAVATWIWWFSAPGLVQQLALSVMVVCSLTTLLLNANPLVRFDGYYILADVLEIPNLRQRASAAWADLLGAIAWGPTLDRRPSPGLVPLVYGLAAAIYRVVLVIGLVWMFERLTAPYQLELVGRMLAGLVVAGLVLSLLMFVRKLISDSLVMRSFRLLRASLTIFALTAAGVYLWHLPMQHRIYCPGTTDWRDRTPIYSAVPGLLDETQVELGTVVDRGDVLLRLTDEDRFVEEAQLQSAVIRQQERIAELLKRRHAEVSAAVELPLAKQKLTNLREQLTRCRDELARLTVRAPAAGLLLAAPGKPAATNPSQLGAWSGQAFDERNRGAFLPAGALLGYVGQPEQLEVTLLIEQAAMSYVAEGQTVELLFPALPHRVWAGQIAEVARAESETIPPELAAAAGGDLPAERDPDSGEARPLLTYYLARVELNDRHGVLRPGLRAQARILVGEITWGRWLQERFWQTFQFGQ